MKRLFAFLCVFVLLFGLTACGSAEKQTTVENKQESVENQKEQQKGDSPNDKEGTKDYASEIHFEEMLVIDNQDCTIKVTGIDADNIWGYTLKVYFENKTSDKTLMYSVVSAAVNGVENDPFFAAEVAAGKKSNEEITFMSGNLDAAGISEVTDIELNFRVYDTNDWMAEDVAQVSVHVYPYGEENAVKYVRTEQADDIVLVNNEYANVVVTGYEWDDFMGYSVNLYIENKSDTSIMVSVDEASVNGYMVDPFYADSVSAGNCAFSSISWFKDNLTENGITEIENIEFVLRVYDENDWMADDFFKDIVVLNP